MSTELVSHQSEILSGDRFSFGENWSRFLSVLNEDRIDKAVESLQGMLGAQSLHGKTFLDAGSGSGLFSLAARKMGAKVHSFDYDPHSVACTTELKRRFFPGDQNWIIQQGSVLDENYLKTLGKFDVVYSWGVLHHTGNQWLAMKNVAELTNPGGKLFIALYNDQGRTSRNWTRVKKIYNHSPGPLKLLSLIPCLIWFWATTVFRDTLKKGNPLYSWNEYYNTRGMSPWHDIVDWVGGYPFEVSRPEEVFEFFRKKGYLLEKLKTCGGGLGCNEYVFQMK